MSTAVEAAPGEEGAAKILYGLFILAAVLERVVNLIIGMGMPVSECTGSG
jgi:hypothetical protein